MIGFRDGPARGAELVLARAPMYLRVVIDETDGKVDALDQLDDTPGPSEQVHVYRRVVYSCGHVCYRGRLRHLSGRYLIGEYEHVPDVDGEQLRRTEAWQQWCRARAATAMAEVV